MKHTNRIHCRQILALFLIVVMLAACTACAGKDEKVTPTGNAAPSSAQSENVTPTTEPTAEPTTEPTTTPTEQVTPTNTPTPTEEAKEPVEGSFSVEGTVLLDALGNPFVMRGVNHAHSWYAQYDEEALAAIAQAGANSVRIVCSNGLQFNKDRTNKLRTIIELCRKYELIAILEVHDGTGDNSVETLSQIGDYWIEVKNALIGNEAYVILNIANEWVGSWDSTIWRDGYTSVIPRLREAGIHNTIMVDAAGWGQYGKSIAEYGKEVFDSDPEHNTMFSIHMYGYAGKNQQSIEENIKAATDQGLCIVVGEFGYKHSDGDVDEAYIMQYCEDNAIGYLGWSWKGNGGGVEYLDLALAWDGSVLSGDWGEILIHGENGIEKTAKPCSVFD